jgi:hypothetical protein
MRPFLVCIHDATPAFDRETRAMLRDLAPLVGRRLSIAVVPNWHGEWPLAAHPDYCRLVQDGAEELLLHGYFHARRHGWGPVSLLAEGCDELNGLDGDATRRLVERGRQDFMDVFGKPARGFLAPAWQRGHVCRGREHSPEHVLGFFSLDGSTGRRIRLATWTWDCGRWRWLGHVGHGIGWLLQTVGRGVPVLAIHPRDIERGFWPGILRLTEELLADGYEPATPGGLLAAADGEIAARRRHGAARTAAHEADR